MLLDERLGRFRRSPPSLRRLANHVEIETKRKIDSLSQVEDIVVVLLQLGIVCYEHRSEKHRLHSDGDLFGYLVNVAGIQDTWVKIKTRGETIRTRRLKIPMLLRQGHKFLPDQPGYGEAKRKVMLMKRIAAFSKECHNVYFEFNNHIFSLSLSLADGDLSFRDYQLEFEYEGQLSGIPSLESAMAQIDALFGRHLPGVIAGLGTRTKGDILLKRRSSSTKY